MKLNEVQCPAMLPEFVEAHESQSQCASYEVSFGLPIYKDHEYEEVIIEANCDSCGHQFQIHGHVIVDKME